MDTCKKAISSFIALLTIITSLFLPLGCAEAPINEPPIKDPSARLFEGSFDQVWRNIQLAMRKYPVRINNIDGGLLETDYIKADKLFIQPFPTLTSQPGLRYKITVRAIKGQSEGKTVIKVILMKTAEIQNNFFEGFHSVPSNGLEELAILYRIGRYLEMDQILAKAANQPKK